MITRKRLPKLAFTVAAVLAALAPLTRTDTGQSASMPGPFPGWPASHAGRALVPLPMSDREMAFARDFPGMTGRFHDGEREIIVRYMTIPTRRLHPAADCLRGIGFSIAPLPARRDAPGTVMSCLKATREGHAIEVCEYVQAATGESWPDVSSWYWSALMGGAKGPWWSFVVAAPARDQQ